MIPSRPAPALRGLWLSKCPQIIDFRIPTERKTGTFITRRVRGFSPKTVLDLLRITPLKRFKIVRFSITRKIC